MSYLYHVDINSPLNADLMKYCKMENVPLAVLLYVDEPRKTFRIRLESMAFHLLQRIDRRLNALIVRLSTDVEHSRMVQRQL
ncbi:MAG: hypothetical protein ACYCYM_14600 [Saccharofermentanales bacterium]